MNKYTEAIQGDDVVILCDGIPMGVGEILAALNAATPPADAALADDALCESLIEASDMRWNGDVYVGDGADLMNLVRAALRARAVPEELPLFDAAIAVELPCVSVVPYNSKEICTWFAKNVRERMLAASKGEKP